MARLWVLIKKNFLSWGIIGLLVFIPLYPKFPLFNFPGTYVAVRLEDFLVFLFFLAWLLTEIKNRGRLFRQRLPVLFLLYFLVGLVTSLNAIFITKVVSPHLVLLHFVRRIEYMSLFLITLSAFRQRLRPGGVALSLGFSTALVLVFALGQKYFGWPVISTMNEEFSKGIILYLSEWTRISATFAGHYDLAAFAVLIISFFLVLGLGRFGKFVRLAGAVFFFISFYLLLATASRTSFAAYLLVVIFVLVFLKRKRYLAPVLLFSFFCLGLNGDLGQRYFATFGNIKIDWRRFLPRQTATEVIPTVTPTPIVVSGGPAKPGAATPTPVVSPVESKEPINLIPVYPSPEPIVVAAQRSNSIRFQVEWPRAIRAFLKNPLLGTGYSSVTLATDNDYLRALAETGLLGFFSLGLIFLEIGQLFLAFLRCPVTFEEKALVVGLMGSVLGFLANAFFIDVFEASKAAFIFWILTGTLVGIINQRLARKI